MGTKTREQTEHTISTIISGAVDMADRSKRVVYIGELDENTAKEVITALMMFDMESRDPIRVIINSSGGYIHTQNAIYDAMRVCKASLVTIGIGKIMSASVLLLAAGTKGERRIARTARVMIHEISSHTYGKLYEIETDLEETKYLQHLMEKCLAMECGKTVKDVKKFLSTHKDKYMSAAEAKRFGIVDKIV